MILENSKGQTIHTETKELAKGGQGFIYKLTRSPYSEPMVAKIYHTSPAENLQKLPMLQRRLEYMVKNNPFSNSTQKVKETFIWPVDCLYQNGKFVGFVMPFVSQSSPGLDLILSKKMPSGFEKFDISDSNSLNKRLIICYNIARAISELHNSGTYILVDFKPANFMLLQNGYVRIVDLDSIQISSGNQVKIPGDVATPEYTPPECTITQKVNFKIHKIDPSWDVYSFAVSAYYLLFKVHPFTSLTHKTDPNFHTYEDFIRHNLFPHGKGRSEVSPAPPHDNFSLLSNTLQNIFIQTLDTALFEPMNRPSMDEWSKVLLKEIQQNKNTQKSCSKNQASGKKKNPGKIIPKKQQPQYPPQIQTQSGAIIQQFQIVPAGANQFSIVWEVNQAAHVQLNGVTVTNTGSQMYPMGNQSFKLEAFDSNGRSISRTIQSSFSHLQINHFHHEILNNAIKFSWATSGSSVTLNGISIPANGTKNLPLLIDTYTIVVEDSSGFKISQSIQVDALTKIINFQSILTRDAAYLEWDLLNASSVAINGLKQSLNTNRIQIPLTSAHYQLVVKDSQGNSVSQSLHTQIVPTINLFNITEGQDSALIEWEIWHASQCLLNGKSIPSTGAIKVPLLMKDYIIKVVGHDGVVHEQIKAFIPRNIPTKIIQPKRLISFPTSLSNKNIKLRKAPTSLSIKGIDALKKGGIVLQKRPMALNKISTELKQPLMELSKRSLYLEELV